MIEQTTSEIAKLDKMVTDSKIFSVDALQITLVPGQLMISLSEKTVTAAILTEAGETTNPYVVTVYQFDQIRQALFFKATMTLELQGDWWRGTKDLG